jgi:hypothetical protein
MPDARALDVNELDVTETVSGPTRCPNALCNRCGHLGTWAYTTHLRVGLPAETRRFCRRCWPAARLAELDRERRAREEGHVEELEQVPAAIAGQAIARDGTLHRTTSAWHLSLAPGTLWRYLRASRIL